MDKGQLKLGLKVQPYKIIGNYKLACDPSQYGGFFVCLHKQIAAVLVSSALNTLGAISVHLCAPLNHALFSDFPHAHHAYNFPFSNCSICGDLPATIALLILVKFCLHKYRQLLMAKR
jgi:hypothetical protein